MPFLDIISNKSKDVAQKAKDVTEQTKLKNLAKSEQEKIESLYAAIGKIYYESEAEPIKEPYADIIRTIHLSMDKLEEYEERINSLKTKYVCPNCGTPVTSTTQFCKNCGTRITSFH